MENMLVEVDLINTDTEMYATLRQMNCYFNECTNILNMYKENISAGFSILFKESDDEDSEKSSGSSSSGGILKRMYTSIKNILIKIWEWLKKTVKMIGDILTKPFKFVLRLGKKKSGGDAGADDSGSSGGSDEKKEKSSEKSDKKDDEFTYNPKGPKNTPNGVFMRLGGFYTMMSLRETGIDSLGDVSEIYTKIISEGTDLKVSKDMETKRKRATKDEYSEDEGDSEKIARGNNDNEIRSGESKPSSADNIGSLISTHKSCLKAIQQFNTILSDIIEMGSMNSKTNKEKTWDEIVSEQTSKIKKLQGLDSAKNFAEYLTADGEKFFHILDSYRNDKIDVVTKCEFKFDNTRVAEMTRLIGIKKQSIQSILGGTDSGHAHVLIDSVISSNDPIFTDKVKSSQAYKEVEALAKKLGRGFELTPNNTKDYLKFVNEYFKLTELGHKNSSDNFTMKKSGNKYSTNKTDIFKCIDYTIEVDNTTVGALMGDYNTYTKIKNAVSGKTKSPLFETVRKDDASDITTAMGQYSKYIKEIGKNMVDIKDNGEQDTGKPVTIGAEDNISKSKALAKEKGDKKEVAKNWNNTVIETTKIGLKSLKEEVNAVINQMMDIEKHTRLVRQSRINAKLVTELVGFTSLVFTENALCSYIESVIESAEEGSKKAFAESMANRRKIYASAINVL